MVSVNRKNTTGCVVDVTIDRFRRYQQEAFAPRNESSRSGYPQAVVTCCGYHGRRQVLGLDPATARRVAAQITASPSAQTPLACLTYLTIALYTQFRSAIRLQPSPRCAWMTMAPTTPDGWKLLTPDPQSNPCGIKTLISPFSDAAPWRYVRRLPCTVRPNCCRCSVGRFGMVASSTARTVKGWPP